MNTIAERLRELRKQLELSQTDFGKKIGKNYHSVMRWELGKVLPPDNVIEHICTTFGINAEWLTKGIGDVFIGRTAGILRENENILYSGSRHTVIPVFEKLSEDFPDGCEKHICGQVSTSASTLPLFAVRAAADSAPPVLKDDVVIFTSETDDIDGKLCIIIDRFGTTSIRWYYKKENLIVSKRTEYPDISAFEVRIIGTVKEIIRKISF